MKTRKFQTLRRVFKSGHPSKCVVFTMLSQQRSILAVLPSVDLIPTATSVTGERDSLNGV